MFKALLKINLSNLFYAVFSNRSTRKKKKSPFFVILIVLAGAYLAGSFMFGIGFLLSPLARSLPPMGLDRLYFSLAAVLIFFFSFIGSVFAAQNLIFNAGDNEALLSMPIPPLYVVLSRIAPLVPLNLLYGAVVSVPVAVSYFRAVGFSARILASFAAAAALTAIFSSAISCFLGWLGALVGSRFKRTELLQTVISLIFFGANFAVCFNARKYIYGLIENGTAADEAIKRAAPVFYYFGVFCSEQSVLSSVVLTLLCVAPFVVACLAAAKSFVKITAGKKSFSGKKYVEKELKVSPVKAALVKKELKRFFSLPVLILNGASGCVMQILFLISITIRGGSIVQAFSYMGGADPAQIVPIIIGTVMSFCSVMVNFSACSISLEGDKINLLRSLPISSGDFYFAKFASNYIIGAPVLVVCSAVSCAVLGVKASVSLNLTLLLALFFAVSTLINLIANVLSPKFSWNSEAVVVKQSLSVIAGLSGGAATAAATFVPYFAIGNGVSLSAYLLCAQIFLIFCAAAAILFLKTSGKKRFESMCV